MSLNTHLNGAKPVPGPTIISGVEAAFGNLKSGLLLIYTGSFSPSCNVQFEVFSVCLTKQSIPQVCIRITLLGCFQDHSSFIAIHLKLLQISRSLQTCRTKCQLVRPLKGALNRQEQASKSAKVALCCQKGDTIEMMSFHTVKASRRSKALLHLDALSKEG